MEQIRLGRKVRVSDPCYGTSVWCAGTLDNVKEGLYNVEVDSGQAGIYDEDYYNKYHTADGCDDDWYDDICNLTNPAGTKDGKCVVSSSGYGDGGYTCYMLVDDDNQVVAISIVFIEDEEEDEE